MTATRKLALQDRPGSCSRRDFLATVLLGLLAGATGACRLPASGATGRPAEPAWLQAVITDREAAARIGRGYLQAFPAERDAGHLARAILEAAEHGGHSLSGTIDARQAVAVLRQLVREDYVRDNAVSVDQWVLSRNEARLYALASVVATTPGQGS